jgi:hypothetical protein
VNAFDEKRYQKGQKNFHELDQRLLAQNGTSPARLPVPCALLNLQISFPNRLRASGGVAWIIATASDTDILSGGA